MVGLWCSIRASSLIGLTSSFPGPEAGRLQPRDIFPWAYAEPRRVVHQKIRRRPDSTSSRPFGLSRLPAAQLGLHGALQRVRSSCSGLLLQWRTSRKPYCVLTVRSSWGRAARQSPRPAIILSLSVILHAGKQRYWGLSSVHQVRAPRMLPTTQLETWCCSGVEVPPAKTEPVVFRALPEDLRRTRTSSASRPTN